MKVLVHSPSSISTARQCPRKWWLRYREGIKQPEVTWAQVKAWDAWRAKPIGKRPFEPAPAERSTALGKEVHRLAELYLEKRTMQAGWRQVWLIDWNDLPGQCLAELIPLLPPAGSVPRKNLERNVTVRVDGVSFRGIIDLVGAAAAGVVESYDHKSSGDIRKYALLPHRVAVRTYQPRRSLRDDLQACMYVLARAKETNPPARGGLCKWNYTETKRTRRSLPVVQYVPTAHATTVMQAAAATAKQVAGFKTIDDAVPDTTACSEYGGCWYRIEGHCTVRRHWGRVFLKMERDEREQAERMKIMGKELSIKELRAATARANAEAEKEAERARAKAKRKAAVEEDEEAPESEAPESVEEEAPESEEAPPPPRKRKAKPAPEPVEEDDEDDAPESEVEAPAPKAVRQGKAAPSARAAAQAAFDKAVPAEDPRLTDDVERTHAALYVAFSNFTKALIKAVR